MFQYHLADWLVLSGENTKKWNGSMSSAIAQAIATSEPALGKAVILPAVKGTVVINDRYLSASTCFLVYIVDNSCVKTTYRQVVDII